MEHQHYTSTFPALPKSPEPQLQKAEYKKRPRDIPKTHTQNIKQIKLHDYWLNPPPPQTTNRFDALTEDDQDEGGEKANHKSPKPPPIFVAGQYKTIQTVVSNCIWRRIRTQISKQQSSQSSTKIRRQIQNNDTSTDRKTHRVPYIPTQRRMMFPYSPQGYALLH
jgi:hypothetical protein